MSKIQSESNSQLLADVGFVGLGCDQYVKDTIWKQFTTPTNGDTAKAGCDQYVKDTIWKQFTTLVFGCSFFIWLWPICQRYNLKAIHNDRPLDYSIFLVVTNMSKIQSESNSQRSECWPKLTLRCDQYVKDTIWKQFTTWMNCLKLII